MTAIAVKPTRIRNLNTAEIASGGGGVTYWMGRDARVQDNWALLHAAELAAKHGLPLSVVYCMPPPSGPEATLRRYDFLLGGLAEVEAELGGLGVPFRLLRGAPADEVPAFAKRHGVRAIVTDFSPLRAPRGWKEAVAAALPATPLIEVDEDASGALDANDAFPLDARYALDVDSDGMADEWEAAYGLNASDPTDAYQDADTDGVLNLQEFLAETDPQDGGVDAQILYTDKPATLIPGRSGRFTVNYTTNTDDPNLSGVGVRVHYDSSYVTSVTLDSIFATGLIGQSDEADIEDWDMDPATDRFILISWASFSGPAWPGELPTALFDVVIESRQEIEALSSYAIRFSNAGSSEGYALSAPSVYNPVVLASLDIDGDGEAKALTDGLLVIRRLFGFSGTSLAAGAVSGACRR